MIRKIKSVYRSGINNKFSFTRVGSEWSFVGCFEQREYDEVVSWFFVFSDYATQDTAANQWVYEQLCALNEVK